MPAFKTDESFLEKVSMGATGTRKVLANLAEQGHQPIELERFSTSFKIWKQIKIKRIRVPDILCITCAHRIESRSKKSRFEISMSHSTSDPQRGWDTGLTDNDYVSIAVCERSGERPIDWIALDPVQYISVKALRDAHQNKQTQISKPKGAQEGFEIRIVWPAATASTLGTVTEIDEKRIRYRASHGGRTRWIGRNRGNISMSPLVRLGEEVLPHQVLASVAHVSNSFPCEPEVDTGYYVSQLQSLSLSDRYTAAKALAHIGSGEAEHALAQRLQDNEEHIYVRLESAAGLARRGQEIAWTFLERTLHDEYLQHRLEAVIVLAEICSERSLDLLANVIADHSQHSEIRAGAAWGLGDLNNRRALDILLSAFSDTEDLLRIEAARALARLTVSFSDDVLEAFSNVSEIQRPGVAWALSQTGTFGVQEALKSLSSLDARQWTAYILGTQQEDRMAAEIEQLRERDPEVYFAVTVLWKIVTSWAYQLEAYG